jgi:hypothetical protein
MTFKITTDLQNRSQKPQGQEIAAVSQALNIPVEVTIQEFSRMMSAGMTFSPALFKNNQRKNANWQEQSVFALDFDSGVTPEEIVSRFNKHSIDPNVVYLSFSDTPEHRKFRVVLFLDTVIKDAVQRDFIQRGLMELIGDVDAACKDAARLYFGGTESFINSEKPVDLIKLGDILNILKIKGDSGKTRKIVNFVQKGESLYSNIEVHGFGQVSQIEHFDWDKLYSEVRIWREFVDGTFLPHAQMFGLTTAMIWVKGGTSRIKEIMDKWNKEKGLYTADAKYAMLTYVKKMAYQPQRLAAYSPYEEDWEHLNPLTAVREQRGMVDVLEEVERLPLAEAERRFQTFFREIQKTDDTNIYILRVPTGIGKTALLESVTATIAFPTNSLKDEVYERVIVDKVKTPTLPPLQDEEFRSRIEYLYRVGLQDVAIKMIQRAAISNDYFLSTIEKEALKGYLKDLRHSYASDKAVLTTHTRAIYSEFKSRTIIFDEDPLTSILQMKSFSIADFMRLESQDMFGKNVEYAGVVDYLRDIPKGQVIATPQFSLDVEKLARDISSNGKIDDDLISFINSDFFIRDSFNANKFTYIIRKDLPVDKKVIILSATVPIKIYQALYGDRVKVIDITDVEHTGKIIQSTNKSYSRESLRLSLERIDEIVDTQLPTITFAEFVGQIQNAVQTMYFGNVSGYDSLKGMDMNVLGTPHLHTSTYLLIANSIGLRLKPNDLIMDYQSVEWNKFKFKFNTYSHPDLREIQLSMIESELLQAIGRARALREHCTVYVYSNLPLRIASNMSNAKIIQKN